MKYSKLIHRSLWILAVLLMAVGAQAQSSQKGYTKTKGRMDASGKVIPGSRLSDVSVILQGDNSTVSDADGNFSLLVSSNKFYLKNVRKTGYVLVDPDVLSKQYACSPNAFIIVLETPGEQADDKLAAERKIRRALQRQLQEREDELEDLARRQGLLGQSVAYEQWQLEDLAQRCYNKFEIFKMQHQLDSAAYYIETRADLDTLNAQWLSDAADFLHEYKADYPRALEYYQRALEILKQLYDENHPAIALIYDNISGVYSKLENKDKAEEYRQKALEIRQKLETE